MPATRMQQRRDTAANWTLVNPILASGEIGLETDTRLTKIGDGSTPWVALGYQQDRNLYSAAGDILIASAAKTPIKVAKGANGQYLGVSAGTVGWVTPPSTDLSSTVALDGSRDMTGNQQILKTNPRLRLQHGLTDRIQMYADTDLEYIQVDDELHITGIAGTIGTDPKPLRAGAIYDTGNRVYSASNPPPGGTVTTPGYNCWTWIPNATDLLPLTGATIQAGANGKMVYQAAAASTSAVPAGFLGVPRFGFNQITPGSMILEGLIVRLATAAGTTITGLCSTDNGVLTNIRQFLGFAIDGATGDVKAYSYIGGQVGAGTIPATNGTQRGSTQSAVAVVNVPIYFKITVTAAGVVTFVLGGITVYTGSLGISLYDTTNNGAAPGLIANQQSAGTSGNVAGSHFIVSYA